MKIDRTGQEFGNLTVIKETERREVGSGSVIWECLCSCGNTCYVSGNNLSRKGVSSCGCIGKENSIRNGRKAGEETRKRCMDGTNISNLTARKPKNNTSGVKGVTWDNSRKKWMAQIVFKGKSYYLGRYSTLEEAAGARKIAEKRLFGKFLESKTLEK